MPESAHDHPDGSKTRFAHRAVEATTPDGSLRYRRGMQRFLETTTPDISGVWLLH
jgi:hypothetical protein